MNMQATGQTIAAPRPVLSPTERYLMSTATARTVSAPRWMRRTGWILSFLVVAQLLSSAWFRATYHTYAVAEIVTGYGYPESAIVLIVIAECALVVLYLVPQTSVLAAILMTGYLGGAVATHLRIADTARAAIPLVVEFSPGAACTCGTAASANLFLSAGRREWDSITLDLLGREHEKVGRRPRPVGIGAHLERIAELGDWRGETLSRMRKLIKEADPDVVEDWKWVRQPNPAPRYGRMTASSALANPTRGREADLRQGRISEGSGPSLQLESRRKRTPRDRHPRRRRS